jgi:hypothetical protein
MVEQQIKTCRLVKEHEGALSGGMRLCMQILFGYSKNPDADTCRVLMPENTDAPTIERCAAALKSRSQNAGSLVVDQPPAAVATEPGAVNSGTFAEGQAAWNGLDFASALRIWSPLARAGNPAAQLAVGNIYARGLGVPKNLATAFKLFEAAAAQDLPGAQVELGILYATGQGVVKDYGGALKWFRRAAEAGDGIAQYMLGHHYASGLGVQTNIVSR